MCTHFARYSVMAHNLWAENHICYILYAILDTVYISYSLYFQCAGPIFKKFYKKRFLYHLDLCVACGTNNYVCNILNVTSKMQYIRHGTNICPMPRFSISIFIFRKVQKVKTKLWQYGLSKPFKSYMTYTVGYIYYLM